MLLLIDAGNTRIKWALVDEAHQSQPGEWVQADSMTHLEFAQQPAPWAGQPIRRAIVSNVAGSTMQVQLNRALQKQAIDIDWFASTLSLAGITNHYQNPAQLGSDRFATAIAVHALFPGQDIIVATCGTATTIDAVSAHGDFIGGMIAPGLLMMAQSLAQKTAQLPHVQDAAAIAARFAGHTEAAIISGCLAAQAGAIEYAVRNFAELAGTDGQPNPLCILSGGAAKYITPGLKVAHRVIDNLVLLGLQVTSC
jgi:type III pantothenate kinase